VCVCVCVCACVCVCGPVAVDLHVVGLETRRKLPTCWYLVVLLLQFVPKNG